MSRGNKAALMKSILKIDTQHIVSVEIEPGQARRYHVDLNAPYPVTYLDGAIEHDEEIVKSLIDAVKTYQGSTNSR